MLAIRPIATSTHLFFLEIPMSTTETKTKTIRLVFALAILCAAFSTTTFASSMYLVQGIAGRDFAAATDPAFPVDIELNNEVCYVHGLAFGAISGPITLAPGSYDVKVSIANSLAPCSEPALISSTVTLGAEKDISAVLSLNESGTPTLSTFTNNLSPVPANIGRVMFAQTANAASVQAVFENTQTKKVYTFTVASGVLLTANLPAGDYTVAVNQGTASLVSTTSLHLYSQATTLLFALGQASNNSVVLENKTLRDVI
jgi:Domain of unknown function (DUF4397)